MKTVRHEIGKLVLSLTLAVAALLLPSSLAHAGNGHGGGHAGWGGPGLASHHGHHPYSGGYGVGWAATTPTGAMIRSTGVTLAMASTVGTWPPVLTSVSTFRSGATRPPVDRALISH